MLVGECFFPRNIFILILSFSQIIKSILPFTITVPTNEHILERQALISSSNLISAGAPSFGGGGSFETMDFSMPSYDGSSSSKSTPPSFTATFSDTTEAAPAPAVDKEAEKEKV
jgi:hypothetical protein